jgi:DNA-binding MarR family transcriptional regulator
MSDASPKSSPSQTPSAGVAFLLSQVGAHVAGTFAERIAPFGLKPYHAGILNILAQQSGLTQQGLAELLGVFPSRLVALLDDLATLELIERRATPTDRRTYALHLTEAGHEMCVRIGQLAEQMQDDICSALDAKERSTLADLLTRIAAQQKITPGVHPGFRKLGNGGGYGD